MKDLSEFKEGMVIRNTGSGNVYVVTGNYGKWVTAVRQMCVTNPSEWEDVNARTIVHEPQVKDESVNPVAAQTMTGLPNSIEAAVLAGS